MIDYCIYVELDEVDPRKVEMNTFIEWLYGKRDEADAKIFVEGKLHDNYDLGYYDAVIDIIHTAQHMRRQD